MPVSGATDHISLSRNHASIWQTSFSINQEKTLSHDKEFYGTFIAVMAGLAILAVILLFTAISLTSDVSEYKPEEIVMENIKPVGGVYIAGESEPEMAATDSATTPDETMTADAGEAAAPKSGGLLHFD